MDIPGAFEMMEEAWGKGRSGYAFLPLWPGNAKTDEERKLGYQEGKAWSWPRERDQMISYIEEHRDDDICWCPNLFLKKDRKAKYSMDEHCLYADLDEIDPRGISDYPPTVAWETSPGRYQALWIFVRGEYYPGASWSGEVNQRLTYNLKADLSGWDTTQILRVPTCGNHKPQYKKQYGGPPPGTWVWSRREWKFERQRYQVDDFTDLPEVEGAVEIDEILDGAIDNVDRNKVWAEVRLKISKRTRQLVDSKYASGDRSATLWSIERDLADAGCVASEIIAIVRDTVWNKYAGRQDELLRLSVEAQRVIAAIPSTVKPQKPIEDSRDLVPQKFFEFLDSVKDPIYLVDRMFNRGMCGFIAAIPKTGKSLIGMDLVFSVATGTSFLDTFEVVEPGPVLYIQEEDGGPTLKRRRELFLRKCGIENPPIASLVLSGFNICDESHQERLDEILKEGFDGSPYVLMVFDTLVSLVGDVDFNSFTQLNATGLKRLKQLSVKHNVTAIMLHHMNKSDGSGKHGGQKMLGSQAIHAWAEDSLYIWETDKPNIFAAERESKLAPRLGFKLRDLHLEAIWEPKVTDIVNEDDLVPEGQAKIHPGKRPPRHRTPHSAPVEVIKTQGPMTPSQLAKASGRTLSQIGNLVRRGTLIRNPQTQMVDLP